VEPVVDQALRDVVDLDPAAFLNGRQSMTNSCALRPFSPLEEDVVVILEPVAM
jgi:hypothetical protein